MQYPWLAAAADELPLDESLCGRRVGHRAADRTARFDRRLERVIKCRHEAPAPEAPVVAAAALAMRASWPRLGGDATREPGQLLPALREDASPLTGLLGWAPRSGGGRYPAGLLARTAAHLLLAAVHREAAAAARTRARRSRLQRPTRLQRPAAHQWRFAPGTVPGSRPRRSRSSGSGRACRCWCTCRPRYRDSRAPRLPAALVALNAALASGARPCSCAPEVSTGNHRQTINLMVRHNHQR